MPVTRNAFRTTVKPFRRSKSKELIPETQNMVKVGIPSNVTPTEKKAPGSIHEILEQMKVPTDNPDSKAGRLAAQRWRSARQIYDEFCSETSFTALNRIHKANHVYKRIAWLVLCLGMMTWLSIQCYWLFEKYYSHPVEVKIEMKAVPKLEFPSVTICNLNPLKRKHMHEPPFALLEDYFHLDDRDSLYDDYWEEARDHLVGLKVSEPEGGGGNETDLLGGGGGNETDFLGGGGGNETDLLGGGGGNETDVLDPFLDLLGGDGGGGGSEESGLGDLEDMTEEIMDYMKNQEFNRWKALENDTDMAESFYKEMDESHIAGMAYANTAVQMPPEELEAFGHHKDDMILSCHYKGMACSPANFTYFSNFKYGNCYTFNAYNSGQEKLYSNYAGPLMGLTLELNIEQDEYIPALSPDAGLRVLIHKRGTYPFPEDEGFSIPPGHKSSVGLDMKHYIRLTPPHADCGDSGVDVENYYVNKFGVDYTKQSCLKSCSQQVIMDTCKCAFSFYYVPPGSNVCDITGNFSDCMENNCDSTLEACNDKCPTPCRETKFGYSLSMSKWPSEQYTGHLDAKLSKTTSRFFDKEDRSDSEDTLAKLEIYFKELIYEKMEQNKAYESQNLISDIGGQLGLWLGLSAITVGELVEFIASICRLSTNKLFKRGEDDGRNGPITKVQPMIP